MNYSYFTRKQANIIYSAVKSGKLQASKKLLNKMYNIVGDTDLSIEDSIFRGHLERAISHLFEDRIEYAQAELDGYVVRSKFVVVDTVEREATEDDWLYEPGEIIVDEIKEQQWFISDHKDFNY